MPSTVSSLLERQPMPHSDSAQATANQVGLAVRSGTPRSTYDGGSLDRHRYRRLDAGGRHRDDGHASARLLGGAARVVDSSSSLEFERVVDAQIPRSRVHLRARAARHEHAAVRKSLTSERQHLICQASMNKVHGEVFDYTEAFSRNIGLLSRAEQEEVRGTRVAIAGLGGVGGNHTLALARRRAPSLSPGCFLAAVLVATEVVNLVMRLYPPKVAPYFCQFDPLVQTYKTGYLRGGNRNPIQRAKRWWVLHTNPVLRAAVEKPDR